MVDQAKPKPSPSAAGAMLKRMGRIFRDEARLVPARDEAAVAAAGIHVNAERLQIADDKVGAIVGRRCQHAEGDRVDARDQNGAGVMGDVGDGRRLGLDEAEIAGALDYHRGGLARDLGAEVGKVRAPGLGIAGDGLHRRERLGEALQLRAPVGAHGLRHEDTAPAGDAAGHGRGAAGRRTGVVGGGRDHLHPHQLAHQALKLEERLVLAVVGIGAAAVGGEELAAMDDLVHDRRHVVLSAAGAAKVEPGPGTGLGCGRRSPRDAVAGPARREAPAASRAIP